MLILSLTILMSSYHISSEKRDRLRSISDVYYLAVASSCTLRRNVIQIKNNTM